MRSASGDDGSATIDRVQLAFLEKNYVFQIREAQQDAPEGPGYYAWFAPRLPGGSVGSGDY